MTVTYARLCDSTIREVFEAYCATRIDINGRHLPYRLDAPPAAPSRSNTISRAQRPACPIGSAAGHPSRVARTPTRA